VTRWGKCSIRRLYEPLRAILPPDPPTTDSESPESAYREYLDAANRSSPRPAGVGWGTSFNYSLGSDVAMIQLTAYRVMGAVQWALMECDTTEDGRRWSCLAQGLEELPAFVESPSDLAWVAMQAAQAVLVARRQ
jgi:hypothetical protein